MNSTFILTFSVVTLFFNISSVVAGDIENERDKIFKELLNRTHDCKDDTVKKQILTLFYKYSAEENNLRQKNDNLPAAENEQVEVFEQCCNEINRILERYEVAQSAKPNWALDPEPDYLPRKSLTI